jgi:hypothetical protein
MFVYYNVNAKERLLPGFIVFTSGFRYKYYMEIQTIIKATQGYRLNSPICNRKKTQYDYRLKLGASSLTLTEITKKVSNAITLVTFIYNNTDSMIVARIAFTVWVNFNKNTKNMFFSTLPTLSKVAVNALFLAHPT